MRLWATEIEAKDPFTGELRRWAGPHVPGIDWDDAEDFCRRNELGYCKVIEELLSEAPSDPNTGRVDWSKKVDYTKIQLN